MDDARERKRPDLPFGRGIIFPSEEAQEQFKDADCKFCDNPDFGLPNLVNNACELYWEHVHGRNRARATCSRYGHGTIRPKEGSL